MKKYVQFIKQPKVELQFGLNGEPIKATLP